MRWVKTRWDFASALILALIGGLALTPDAPKAVTTELISFFSIQAAVILPAMIFTAGIMRSNGLEHSQAKRYHEALKQQMTFWSVLLALDFSSVVLLIIGKATSWSLPALLIGNDYSVNLDALYIACLSFVGSLALLRTIPFIRGVFSLLSLNSEMILAEIRRRNQQEAKERRSHTEQNPIKLPKGYGAIVPNEEKDNS